MKPLQYWIQRAEGEKLGIELVRDAVISIQQRVLSYKAKE